MRIILAILLCSTLLQSQQEAQIVEFVKSKLQFKKYVNAQVQLDLELLQNKQLAPKLLECLQIRRRRADNNFVRKVIIQKLGEFHYVKATKTLCEIIENDQDPWWIKSTAVKALENIGYRNINFYQRVLKLPNVMLQKRTIITLQNITKKKKTITMKSSRAKVLKMRKLWLRWKPSTIKKQPKK